MTPAEREFSAGGVVVNGAGECVVIVPRSRRAKKPLALPKGHVDPGETPDQTAVREVREETGVEAEVIRPLGDVRYWYTREGRRVAKVVRFFLLEHRAGEPTADAHEVTEARWMPLADAVRALSYEGERSMAQRALSIVAADR